MAKWDEDSAWKAGLTAALTGMILKAPRATTHRAVKQMRELGVKYPWQLSRRQMLDIKGRTGAEYYMPTARQETWRWSVETPKDLHLSSEMKHQIYRALVDDAGQSGLDARRLMYEAISPLGVVPPDAIKYSNVRTIDNLRHIVKSINNYRLEAPPDWADSEHGRAQIGAGLRLLRAERDMTQRWTLGGRHGDPIILPIGIETLANGGTLATKPSPGMLHEVFDVPRMIPVSLYSSEIPLKADGGTVVHASPPVVMAHRYLDSKVGVADNRSNSGSDPQLFGGYMTHAPGLYSDPGWPMVLPIRLSDLPARHADVNDPRSVIQHIERVATHETQHLLDSRQGMTFDSYDVPYRDRVQEIRARKAEERIRLDPDARRHTLLNDDMREAAKGGRAPDRFALSRNFLATDETPETLFGIPVVADRSRYTPEDLAFFRKHPEAGGYYDMGDGEEERPGQGQPMQAAVGAGVTFDTPLTDEQERRYQRWRATLPRLLQYEGDYDLRGYWLDPKTVKRGVKDRQHFTDKYKKPNHPTFSVESKYAVGAYKSRAGRWDGDRFIAPGRMGAYPGASNNPGNVEKHERRANKTLFRGEDAGGVRPKRFARFSDPVDGLTAAAMVLARRASGLAAKGLPFTIENYVPGYAPKSENDVEGYINNLSKYSGFARDAVLDTGNAEDMAKLLKNVVRFESGVPNSEWFTDDEYRRAALAMQEGASDR